MKILHVCESLAGGPAAYLNEVIPHQVREFGRDNVVLAAPESDGPYLDEGLGCLIVTYKRSGRNLQSLFALARLIHWSLRRFRPDIVHLHSSFAGALGRLVPLTLVNRPRVVYCAHCWSFDRPRITLASRAWRRIELLLSHLTDRIVNVSPHEQELLLAAGFPRDRITLVMSGIADLPKPPKAPEPRSARSGAALRLLFVGRMDQQKGLDILLREFAQIAPERASLRVVGAPVVDKGRPLFVPGHVEMMGWVPRERVPALMADADAVIMPSRWEGMPLLAIEALRSARPLLASDRGPFPHMISHGADGMLLDIDKPGFLAETIAALETADLARMGDAARAAFKTRFARDRMNRDLVDVYRAVLAMRPRSRAAPSPAMTQRMSQDR